MGLHLKRMNPKYHSARSLTRFDTVEERVLTLRLLTGTLIGFTLFVTMLSGPFIDCAEQYHLQLTARLYDVVLEGKKNHNVAR